MTTSKRDEKLRGWLAGRLPGDWFEAEPEITRDREETLIVGRISAPQLAAETSAEERGAAEAGRITEFRERTRDQRVQIARELEHASGRKVAWGAVCGDTRVLFTTLSVPVMTRLRQPERLILDTLVDSGVARSRSEALAWCVRLVGQHAEEWLAQLRTAMEGVEKVRTQGPG
jgi:hypothetical protein